MKQYANTTTQRRAKLMLHALLSSMILAGCGGGSSSAEDSGPTAQAEAVHNASSVAAKTSSMAASAAVAIAVPALSLWDSPERLPALALASGDGVSTTASSVTALLAGADGNIYYGGREAREDWTGLAKRYATDTSVANWVRNIEMARVDAWIAKKFERTDLVGGWTQAYIDTKTGSGMNWTPDSAEPPNEPAGTPDTASVKRAWVALGRDYNIAQVQAAARIFRVNGQRQYAEWAAQQLDFYAANYANWPLRTNEGRSTMYSQGLDEAVASFKLIDAARLLQSSVEPKRYQTWHDMLFAPMAANLKFTSAPMSNIQLWHQMARAAIAMRYGDLALLDDAQNGTQGIAAVMAADLTADNFWIEGTFAYNAYVIEGLGALLTQAGVEGYGARFAALRDQAVRMLLVTLDYRFDDNTLPNPNDSRSTQDVIPQLAHWQLFRSAPTYWGLAKANAWRTWESLLDPPLAVPTTPPTLPTAQTRNFPAMRQAVLRAGSWQAFLHYGASISNHTQQELTTFELHEGASVIAHDPGTVDYGSPYNQDYFRNGPANNVPLIDGEGQSGWAPGTLNEFDASQNRLTITHAKYQADASLTRSYRLTTQGFVERSSITVPSGKARRLGVVFNTNCTIALGSGTTPSATVDALPNVPAMQTYWSQRAMAKGAAQWQATLSCGGKRYQMTITGPAGQRIYTAKAPDTPLPSTRNAIYYEITGSNATFETEFKALP